MNRADLKQRRAQRRALTFKFDKPLANKYHNTLARAALKLAPVDYTPRKHITS